MDFSSTISFDRNGPFLWNVAEQYLHVTNTSYQATKMERGSLFLKENEAGTSGWPVKALKIISFATVILPVIALVVKATYRSKYTYQISYSIAKVDKEIAVWKKVFEKKLEAVSENEYSSFASLFSRREVSETPPDITLLEKTLSSKKQFRKRYGKTNQIVAEALDYLTTHRDDAKALELAKAVYKKIATFLRENTNKNQFELNFRGDQDRLSEKMGVDLNISFEDCQVLWHLLRNLRKQIKFIGKRQKILEKRDIKDQQEGFAFNTLLWIHGTTASVLKTACEQTSGKILPSGKLLQKKITTLSGEMKIGASMAGVNQQNISGVGLRKGKAALEYAESFLFDLEKNEKALYGELLQRKDSFVKGKASGFEYNAFLDHGLFTRQVVAVQRIHDIDNDLFQKDLPEWKTLVATIKNEMHRAVFIEKPGGIFDWHVDESDFHSFLHALSKLQELIDHPEKSGEITDEDKALARIPLVLGSTTRVGMPVTSGASVSEEDIPGSMKLGKDIQVVFTPQEHVNEVQGIVDRYELTSKVKVAPMDQLRQAIDVDDKLGHYFYDVYNMKKWK